MAQAENKTMNKGEGAEILLKEGAQEHRFFFLLFSCTRITMPKQFSSELLFDFM